MSAANRRRGHNAERAVAAWLRDHGYPDAKTTRAGLGHDGAKAPGDVAFHPLVALEVKDVARSAWPSWQRQAEDEAGEGQIPVVVRRRRGVADVGEWECRVQCDAAMAVGLGLVCTFDDGWLCTPFAALVEAVRRLDA